MIFEMSVPSVIGSGVLYFDKLGEKNEVGTLKNTIGDWYNK